MSYSGADDQSEDGELKRSPLATGNNPDDLDFSLSDDNADTADSLDIKPPQAKLATRTVSRKYERSRDGHGHHSRSDRHRESERHHRESEKRHREKYEASKREYREKERDYREKEYFMKEQQYSTKDVRFVEQIRSTSSRDDRRREDIRYSNESTREIRYSDSKINYSEHEKQRKDRELKYIDYDVETEARRERRETKYYESLEHMEVRRERKEISRRERRDREEIDEKTAADRALEDLRERLLDKRRSKEEEYKMNKTSKRHKSKRENIAVEPGEIVADSKTYVKEIIDLSKSTDEGRSTKQHYRRNEKSKEENEMTVKEREERELRRVKLLEAEREMARQKEKCRQEAEARRERRERKRIHEEQREEAKKRRLEEEEEMKLMKLKAAALSNELSGVVTVSDNTDESEIEMEEAQDISDHKDDDDMTGHSNRSDETDDSGDSSDSGRRRDSDDKESVRSDDYRERSPQSDNERIKSDRRSRSRTRSRSRSKSVSRERSLSHSRSRSRTKSKSPDEEEEEETSKVTTNHQNSDSNNDKEEKEIEEILPPYIPAVQGCRSVEEFQCLNRIEEGTYGVVYRARDKRTDEIVALKRLKMEKEKEGFPITSLREINTLLKGQHPNIVTVREIVVGSNMDKIFIVMDYVEHDLKSLMETMRNKKQGFVPGEVKCLLQQLLRAVAHLHDNWILHRDLKTSNLLLSHKGILKVGDFGLAREYGSPLKAYTPIVVTLWYRAPELLLCAKEYSTPIDMWSVGCIFAELLTMNALFPGKSEVDQLNRIFKDLGTPNEKIWPGYNKLPAVQKVAFSEYPVSQLRTKFSMLSELGLNLLSKFLTYDPSQRITAEDALKHGYFTETPLPIDPAMFPTWPAKSELGHRKAVAASPKPPSGGGQYKKLGDGDDDSALGFHMGNTAATLHETRRLATMGGGFSLKF